VGRNSSLLDQVKESLIEIGTTEGNAHQILVGDVGDAAFWESIKKEVSLSHSRIWVLIRWSRLGYRTIGLLKMGHPSVYILTGSRDR
jgi:hypothetical protein